MIHFYTDTWVDIAQQLREDEIKRASQNKYWRDQLPVKPRRPSRLRSAVISIMGLFL